MPSSKSNFCPVVKQGLGPFMPRQTGVAYERGVGFARVWLQLQFGGAPMGMLRQEVAPPQLSWCLCCY